MNNKDWARNLTSHFPAVINELTTDSMVGRLSKWPEGFFGDGRVRDFATFKSELIDSLGVESVSVPIILSMPEEIGRLMMNVVDRACRGDLPMDVVDQKRRSDRVGQVVTVFNKVLAKEIVVFGGGQFGLLGLDGLQDTRKLAEKILWGH